ncbi:MAG: hypothetical protein QOC95_421 [Thermoleophilaceae bacterium]|jgi:hypothetical protein|nr:hypothetical protein [Thermoleophilaceae bacterium]
MSDLEMETRLDGNAVAGMLSEVFAIEMTDAVGTCHHCGARGALGTTLVYVSGPGTVMRCSACEGVLMRFTRIRGTLSLEVRGVRRLELPG